jgi:hypothetical protein
MDRPGSRDFGHNGKSCLQLLPGNLCLARVSIYRQRIDWHGIFPERLELGRARRGRPLRDRPDLNGNISFTALKFSTITRRPLLSGVIYGCLVYLIMTFMVLPLSGVPHPPAAITVASRINAVLALIFCIGLPISLLTRKIETYGTQSRQIKSDQ